MIKNFKNYNRYTYEDLCWDIINNLSKDIQSQLEEIKIIHNSLEYKEAIKNGDKMDLSKWNLDNNDIQNLDVHDLGLIIPLRRCFLPINGRGQCYISSKLGTCSPLYSLDDDFIDLRNSNFKGNSVIGSLADIFENDHQLTFLYNEDTFDKEYMEFHNKYFLDECAPNELKNFYYNPKEVIVEDEIEEAFIKNLEGNDKKVYKSALRRNELTFEYYLINYKYLHGKYLDRFKISERDKKLISNAEKFGIEEVIKSHIEESNKVKVKK